MACPGARWLTRWLALWLALGLAAPAWACRLQLADSSTLAPYLPAAAARAPEPLALRLSGSAACAGRLSVQGHQSPGQWLLSGPGGTLRVGLWADAAMTAAVPLAPQEFASLQGGGRADLSPAQSSALWLAPLAGQWAAPGVYAGTLRLRLADATGATLDEREAQVSVTVQPAVRVGFGVAGARSARLDFGELASAARRSTVLDIQSNVAHRLRIDSTQAGRLVNRQHPQQSVAYRLTIAGQAVAPAGGELSRAGAGGRVSLPLEVILGPVERVLAGEYADDLLLTVTAQ